MNKYSVFVFKSIRPNPEAKEDMDWNAQSDWDDVQERKVFEKEYNRFIKALENMPTSDIDTYDEVYRKGVKKLCTYFNFPMVKLKDLGVLRGSDNEMTITPMPVGSVRSYKDSIIANMCHKTEGMYDGDSGEIVFSLISEKLDEHFATWLPVDFMEEVISKLGEKIDTKNKVYGKEYKQMARAIRKDFKRFVKMCNKECRFYAIVLAESGEQTNKQ